MPLSGQDHDSGDSDSSSGRSSDFVLPLPVLLGALLLLFLSLVPTIASGCSATAAQVAPTPTAPKPAQATPVPTIAPSATATPVPTATAVPATSTPTSVPVTATPTPRPQVLGPNLLPNPSFEDMTDGLPDGWTSSPRNAPLHVVRPGNNGRFAAGFSSGIPETSLLLAPKTPIPVTPYLTYKFVGWARGGGISQGCAQVAFRGVDDGNAVCFADAPMSDGRSPVPYSWTKAEFTVNIPEGVTSVDFSLIYYWTGDPAAQVYWDDLYFGELERY